MTACEAQENPVQRKLGSAIRDRLKAEVSVSSREGIAGIVLLYILLLATRPYEGIIHDAMLYAAQGLHRIDNGALSEDLFFRFGNQDSFSLFTRIYAPVIGMIGVAKAHAVFWIAGLIGWLLGLISLSRAIFGKTYMSFAAAAAAILLNPTYGSLGLGYAENFVTPRLLAESFGMAAIAAVLNRTFVQAFLFLLAATVMHPIMTVLFAAFGLWLTLNNWRLYLMICASVAAAVCAMALAAIPPFDWMLEQYDAAWFTTLQERKSWLLFLERQPLVLFSGFMLPCLSLLVVAVEQYSRFKRLALAAIIIPLALLCFSIFAAYALQNRFLTSMQFWRALLLFQLFGNLFAVHAVLNLGAQFSRTRPLFALAMGYCVLEQLSGFSPLGSAVMSVASLITYFFERSGNGIRPGLGVRVLTDLIVVVAVLITLPYLIGLPLMTWELEAQVKFLLRTGLIVLAIWLLFRPRTNNASGYKIFIGAMCLTAALATIDDRSLSQKFVEQSAPLGSRIGENLHGRNVYWEDNLALLWLKLGLPSYYGCRQMGGMGFFRAQAFEFERRAAGLRVLNTEDFAEDINSACPMKQNPDQQGPVETSQLQSACTALPELDLLILRSGIPGGYRETVTLPVPTYAPRAAGNVFEKPMMESETTPYFIYDCADFRS